MSKRYEEEVRQTTHTVLVEMKCDLCGKTTEALHPYPGGDIRPASNNWATDMYEVKEVSLSYRTGDRYPDGGSGEILGFDVCPTCFLGKVVPWFRSQGAEPSTETWDY